MYSWFHAIIKKVHDLANFEGYAAVLEGKWFTKPTLYMYVYRYLPSSVLRKLLY